MDVYELILRQRAEDLRNAIQLCASEDSLPLLIHCTHGKDRTGVLVALLLSACGISQEDIIEDYALSHDWGCSVPGRWAMQQSLPSRIRPYVSASVVDDWCKAPEYQMSELFRRAEVWAAWHHMACPRIS